MNNNYKTFQGTTDFSLNYYVYLPKDYNQTESKKWPLILFLHGAGERGDSIEELPLVLQNGLPNNLENRDDFKDFPFIVICPQCPKNSYWPVQVDHLDKLLDHVIETYEVDEDCVYLTGLSMGGYGTWYMGYCYPERFAALAPVCGSGIRSSAAKLKDIPIWVFHGEEDPIVPFSDSEYLVNSIKQAGGNIRFTKYPNTGHDSWTETYLNKELYNWFLSHTR